MDGDATNPHSREGDYEKTARGFTVGGTVFGGRYKLLKKLGQGGMGLVWLAEDSTFNRPVAIKVLPPHLVFDRMCLEELKKEAARSIRLTHTNIVSTRDFLQDDEGAGIVMDFVDGDTLHNMMALQPNRVFEVNERLAKWMRQLCAGLTHAHEEVKLVHRDLKPPNLMVNKADNLLITDFGISRTISESVSRSAAASSRNSQSIGAGTPPFMSPQQLEGKPPRVSDDIYSLGATLYCLLTSKPPFHRGGIDYQIVHVVAPSMKERRKELGIQGSKIPEDWEEMVAACLAKDVARRPQTVKEVAALVNLHEEVIREHKAILAKSLISRPSPQAAKPSKWNFPPIGRLLGWVILALLVATSTVGFWLLTSAQLAVTSTPMLAQVTVVAGERSPQIKTAWPLLGARFWGLQTGSNQVAVTKSGYTNLVRTVVISNESRIRIPLVLVRAPTVRPPDQPTELASLTIRTEPRDAWVELRGTNAFLALNHDSWLLRSLRSVTFTQLKPGPYTLTVQKPGYESTNLVFQILANREFRPMVPDTIRLIAASGTFEIDCPESNVRIFLTHLKTGQTEELGRTPLATPTFARPAGAYKITAARERWKTQEQSIDLKPTHETQTVRFQFATDIEVTSDPPGAAFTWNGTLYSTKTKVILRNVRPGRLELIFHKEGYEDSIYEGEIREHMEPIRVTLKPAANPTGNLAVSANYSDAQLLISGYKPALISEQPTVALPIGKHTITVKAAGCAPQEHKIEIAAGKTTSLTTTLEALPRPIPLDLSPPNATVLVNNTASDPEALRTTGLLPGTYTLSATAPDHLPISQVITIDRIRPVDPVRLSLAKAPPRPGKLLFTWTPTQANPNILLDGRALSVGELKEFEFVPEKTHSIAISARGYNTETRSVSFRGQSPFSLNVPLTARPRKILVTTEPGSAEIKVDGQVTAADRLREVGLAPGSHTFEVTYPDHQGQKRMVHIDPDDSLLTLPPFKLVPIIKEPAVAIPVTILPLNATVEVNDGEKSKRIGVDDLKNRGLPPGEYQLHASAPGYQEQTWHLKLDVDRPVPPLRLAQLQDPPTIPPTDTSGPVSGCQIRLPDGASAQVLYPDRSPVSYAGMAVRGTKGLKVKEPGDYLIVILSKNSEVRKELRRTLKIGVNTITEQEIQATPPTR